MLYRNTKTAHIKLDKKAGANKCLFHPKEIKASKNRKAATKIPITILFFFLKQNKTLK